MTCVLAGVADDLQGDYEVVPVDGPETVAIVGCTKTKRQPGEGNAIPARDLYAKSDYFQKTWKYAGQVADQRYIVSAKHALVHPDDELEHYEAYLPDLDAGEYEDLLTEVHWQLGGLVGGALPLGAELVVVGGKAYVELVEDVLEWTDYGGWINLSTPLQDHVNGGIGAQKAWLSERVKDTDQATLGEVMA